MKDIYANFGDGTRLLLMSVSDGVETDRWAARRLEDLRGMGAESISCEVHADELLEKIDRLLPHCA